MPPGRIFFARDTCNYTLGTRPARTRMPRKSASRRRVKSARSPRPSKTQRRAPRRSRSNRRRANRRYAEGTFRGLGQWNGKWQEDKDNRNDSAFMKNGNLIQIARDSGISMFPGMAAMGLKKLLETPLVLHFNYESQHLEISGTKYPTNLKNAIVQPNALTALANRFFGEIATRIETIEDKSVAILTTVCKPSECALTFRTTFTLDDENTLHMTVQIIDARENNLASSVSFTRVFHKEI